jgi:hypothetical protein
LLCGPPIAVYVECKIQVYIEIVGVDGFVLG